VDVTGEEDRVAGASLERELQHPLAVRGVAVSGVDEQRETALRE